MGGLEGLGVPKLRFTLDPQQGERHHSDAVVTSEGELPAQPERQGCGHFRSRQTHPVREKRIIAVTWYFYGSTLLFVGVLRYFSSEIPEGS